MREILVISIGTGDPKHLTVQAIEAMNRTDVFFCMDKGPAKAALAEHRRALCRQFIRNRDYRFVMLDDPTRDAAVSDYLQRVRDWHDARARSWERAIADHLPAGATGAFLVWGDASLYDSTLRVLAQIRARALVSFRCEVVPGISSVQALAAAHQIPLHGIGESFEVTTGRLVRNGEREAESTRVVMLDGQCAFREVEEPGEREIFWGAYLGSEHEVTISGPLNVAGPRIERVRANLRAEHGWIMDVYMLRPRRRSGGAPRSRGTHPAAKGKAD